MTTHAGAYSRAYKSWQHMLQRCGNKNNDAWMDYGGRGIRVCDRWLEFANFHADMGDPPPGKTLDRINFDGNYELSNCRWADWKTQAQNRRNTSFVTFDGERICLTEAIQRLRSIAKESQYGDLGVRIETNSGIVRVR
jgi:hypothetical protein